MQPQDVGRLYRANNGITNGTSIMKLIKYDVDTVEHGTI